MISRPVLSIFELCQAIAQLTLYLENIHSISEFIPSDKLQINGIINPSYLAFELIVNKKVNLYIKRNNEEISIHDLIINPYDISFIKQYYLTQMDNFKNEFISKK